jgi:protein-S-isoprenylcysteine O-methyltransferase Ste14
MMSVRPTPLDIRIPPPAVMLLIGAMMWWMARLAPQFAFDWAPQWLLATLLAVIGLIFELLPGLRFSRVGTTVNPMRPQSSAHLVVDGLNRYSRNPMYVGQLMLLLAWSMVLGNVASILLVLAFPLYITRFQILPEERALAVRFGDDYAAYRARVRRWL